MQQLHLSFLKSLAGYSTVKSGGDQYVTRGAKISSLLLSLVSFINATDRSALLSIGLCVKQEAAWSMRPLYPNGLSRQPGHWPDFNTDDHLDVTSVL